LPIDTNEAIEATSRREAVLLTTLANLRQFSDVSVDGAHERIIDTITEATTSQYFTPNEVLSTANGLIAIGKCYSDAGILTVAVSYYGAAIQHLAEFDGHGLADQKYFRWAQTNSNCYTPGYSIFSTFAE
jgi:hypothetical protein